MLTSPQRVKEILAAYQLNAKKKYGQNFLIDQNILLKIIEAAELKQDDCVLEIGPGLGTLTVEMLHRVARLLAVEIDSDLIAVIQSMVGDQPNFKMMNQDILTADLTREVFPWLSPGTVKVVANLPYYITTPILMRLLEGAFDIERMVVMVQKEVGERICAQPNSKQYGALTIAVQSRMQPNIVCKVPASVFYPMPGVDSVVLQLIRKEENIFADIDERLFFKIVRAGFNQRRKTLLNALSGQGFAQSKSHLEALLLQSKIDPNRRAETLSLMELSQLTKNIENAAT